MASELRLTTLANNAGTESVDTTYVINGSAKAWVNFTTITTTSARDSFNVSSLTDLGTGSTTITYSSSMGSANYAGSYYTGANDSGTGYNTFNNDWTGGFGSKTSSSVTAGSYNNSFVDSHKNDVVVMGDLA